MIPSFILSSVQQDLQWILFATILNFNAYRMNILIPEKKLLQDNLSNKQ